MQEEESKDAAVAPVWVRPNEKTIEFSEKKRREMFKPFQHMDQIKLVSQPRLLAEFIFSFFNLIICLQNEIGHQFQNEVLAAVNAAGESYQETENASQLSRDNHVFLLRMGALVNEIAKWAERDETSRMGKLDWLKIDLLYVSDLQNVFCEYLQHYVAILRRENPTSTQNLIEVDGGPDGPYSFEKVMLVVRTLRLMINQAANCAFFGCLQVSIVKLDKYVRLTKNVTSLDHPVNYDKVKELE